MKHWLSKIIKRVLRRLGDTTGVPQALAAIEERISRIEQALAKASLERQLPATAKGVQLLLTQMYKGLLHQRLPLPHLHETEFRAFSENGEDGILLYIFSLIGTTNKKCVELCAGDGVECNTANLLVNHGWKGLLIDGNEGHITQGKKFYAGCGTTWADQPSLIASWITTENVNSLMIDNGFEGEIDLFSLDMDGQDYWIWKAITCIQPRVVVLEFNAAWGPEKAVSIPYDLNYHPDYSTQEWTYYGASLPAFVKLGKQKGYRLVGSLHFGHNAFFIRSGIGEDIFPEISMSQCFGQTQMLKNWNSDWIQPDWTIPNVVKRQKDWVEV